MAAQATGHVRLVRRKRGPQFYVKYRPPDGRQVQKRLGPAWLKRSRPPSGYFTWALAEAELQPILAECDRGTLPSREARTFREACDEWLRYVEHERQRAASTVRSYRSVVERLELAFGADTPLDRITTEHVDAYRARLLSEGKLSRRTVQQDMVLLHGIFKRAKRRKWIAANPSEDAERVTLTRTGEFRVLSIEQVEACARAAEGSQAAALIRVAAYTGLRLGELRALRWRDLDFAARTVHVQRNLPTNGAEKRPKSDKVRSVPLIDQAARSLDSLSRRDFYTAPDDRVFISPTGGPIDCGEARDGFYAALNAAGLGELRDEPDPIVFHDLRHTFGTLAVQVWPIADVKAYMGHASISTTEIYVHHVPKHDAAERFTRLVETRMGAVSPGCPEPGASETTERNSAKLRAA
jgi:integrase